MTSIGSHGVGFRSLAINFVRIIRALPRVYDIWFSGRQVFKTLRWSIKAIDESNQLNNRDIGPIAELLPEPLQSVYNFCLSYIYPDWDSNYVRAAVILKGTTIGGGGENLFTSKTGHAIGAFSAAIIQEVVRDEAIIPLIKAAQSSANDVCKYNISVVHKWEIEEIQSQSPEWYALTHSFTERAYLPLVNSYYDGSVQPLISSLVTGASSVAQDITRFRLLDRDMKAIINYLNIHPECIFEDQKPEVESSVVTSENDPAILGQDVHEDL